MKRTYCDPELQLYVEAMITGKMSYTDKEYQKVLRWLWNEYVAICKEGTKAAKIRDKVIEELNQI